jgi:hypothetical protein
MVAASAGRAVFGYFQNLNLLALLEDRRQRRTARQSWFTGSLLCPVAHGLPAGEQVRELTILGQAADLDDGCAYAARHLGAEPGAVRRFVRDWDEEGMSAERLLRELEAVWRERLEDAIAVQALLQHNAKERESAKPASITRGLERA